MATKSTKIAARIQSRGFSASFPLNLSACNVKFAGVEKNHILIFQVFHFPQKELMHYLEIVNPYLIIQNVRGTLRFNCSMQGVTTLFQVDYTIVEPITAKRSEITMESELLTVLSHRDARKTDRAVLMNLLRPYLPKLDRAVEQLVNLWLEPPTIESVSAKLSEKQREEAAWMLYKKYLA